MCILEHIYIYIYIYIEMFRERERERERDRDTVPGCLFSSVDIGYRRYVRIHQQR